MNNSHIITVQARLNPDNRQAKFLELFGEAYGLAVRDVYCNVVVGKEEWFVKGGTGYNQMLLKQGWSSREADSIYKTAQAIQSSLIEGNKLNLEQAQEDLKVVSKKLAKAPIKYRHLLARRRDRLQAKIVKLEKQLENNGEETRVCFGGKKLLRATREWEANGYKSQKEAHQVWERKRSGMIYVEGDKQALYANLSLHIVLSEDEAEADHVLVRVPKFLQKVMDNEQIIKVPAQGFSVKQGRKQLLTVLERKQIIRTSKAGNISKKYYCQSPVTVRINWIEKGSYWRVGASFKSPCAPLTPSIASYCLGLDINPDHVAWALVNQEGNIIRTGKIMLGISGSANQNKDKIGCAIKQIVVLAQGFEQEYGGKVIIAHEELDFIKARAGLRYLPASLSRTLSSFTYNRIIQNLTARSIEAGIEIVAVNPAYSSILGASNYASTMGISVDQGAAVIIARRGLGFTSRVRPTVMQRVFGSAAAIDSACDGDYTQAKRLKTVGKQLLVSSKTGRSATYRGDGLARRASAIIASTSSVTRDSSSQSGSYTVMIPPVSIDTGSRKTERLKAISQ